MTPHVGSTTAWMRAAAIGALALSTLAGCPAPRGPVVAPPSPSSPSGSDVFDALQSNVWYLPTADGKAELYVTELGRGPTVIVLHGGPGNDFNYLVDALRPYLNRYHFVLFDQRGSLLSPVAPDQVATITVAKLVDDLESLREALGESRVVLFGHSWGTFLAAAYYRAHPERVAGIVLAASAPPQSREGASFLDEIKAAHARMAELRKRSEVTAMLEAAGVGGDAATRSPKARRTAVRIRELASTNLWHVERWRELQGGGVYFNPAVEDAIGDSIPMTYDTLEVLLAHPIPVTVLAGDHDYLDPGATTWSALVPRAPAIEVDVIPGAGHYSWIDNPEAFHHALERGLARATGAAGPAPPARSP